MVHHRIPSRDWGEETPHRLSFVIAAYNAERTIAGAVNSCLSQTVPCEVVIVDDGSTDTTADIVESMAKRDSRVRLVKMRHRGIPAAQNEAVRVAMEDIVALQGADDYSLPNRAERILAKMKGVDIVAHSIYINAWSERFGCMERTYFPVSPARKLPIMESQYLPGVPAFRKRVWELRPFREDIPYAVDYAMWVDFILSGLFRIRTVDEGLYEYVRYNGSASDQFARDGRRAASFEKIRALIASYGA